MKGILRYKGGSGSGNFGHKGRPGEVGGSSENVSNAISKFNVSIPNDHIKLIHSITIGNTNFTKGAKITLTKYAGQKELIHEIGHVIFNAKLTPQKLYNTPLFKAIAKKLGAKYGYDPERISMETFAEYYRRYIMDGTELPFTI